MCLASQMVEVNLQIPFVVDHHHLGGKKHLHPLFPRPFIYIEHCITINTLPAWPQIGLSHLLFDHSFLPLFFHLILVDEVTIQPKR